MPGDFGMLPIKLFPTFAVNAQYRKMDLTLKLFNKLPEKLRCKTATLSFKVPATVEKVFFSGQNVN
jgi:hypothetical protein